MAVSVSGTTFDGAHPRRLAEFWSTLLGFDATDVSGEGALIVERGGEPRWIWFQKVSEPKVAKTRCHLDLEADDLDSEIARAESLATTVARHRGGSWSWNVMQDPEGNEFCLGTKVPG